ncbi:hypothetical protein HMPREF3156_02405, partial [Neisseria sp. HMSC06F02]
MFPIHRLYISRHSRAGGNPVLSAQKSIGKKSFLNSTFWIPACAG